MPSTLTRKLKIGDDEFICTLAPFGERILRLWSFSFSRIMPDGTLTRNITGTSRNQSVRVFRWVRDELTRICLDERSEISIIVFTSQNKKLCEIYRKFLQAHTSQIKMTFFSDLNDSGYEVFFMVNSGISADPARLCVARDRNIRSNFQIKEFSRILDGHLSIESSVRIQIPLKSHECE